MSSPKLMFLLALLLFISNIYHAQTEDVYGDGTPAQSACTNCSICPYACQPQPPTQYPSYGAPPPPLPPPPPSALGNCPPNPVQCCQYSPPTPPTPYTYVPYNNYSASSPLPSLIMPPRTLWSSAIFWWLFLFVFVFHV